MPSLRMTTLAACVAILCASCWSPAQAASGDPALDAEILRIQGTWENIKFNEKDASQQFKEITALVKSADALVAKYPNRPEPLIWDGIVTSETAGMASMFSALGYAKRARDLLLKAEKIDPAALDAGAPTSLGVLYYRVPGFPVGFGNTTTAAKYLKEALKLAPDGMDANYFTGDYLVEQGEYQKAKAVLEHALTLPARPDRPDWDYHRRAVIRELLAKIASKVG
jgi:tetratricopeptide (TPR) repeat protein